MKTRIKRKHETSQICNSIRQITRKCMNWTRSYQSKPQKLLRYQESLEKFNARIYVRLTCKISKNPYKEIGGQHKFERKTAKDKHCAELPRKGNSQEDYNQVQD